MSADECKLVQLPDEVLVEILSRCSVEDVVHLEMTCKRLRYIFGTRMVWLKLLCRLDIEYAPDLPPHVPIQALNVSDLRRKVTDAVRSFQSWNRPEGLRIFYDLALHFKPPENNQYPTTASLLPGGRQLLLTNAGRLELWCFDEYSCIWRAPPFFGCHECMSYDFEVVQDGSAVVIVGEFISPQQLATYLRVFRCELKDGPCELVYDICLPYTSLFRLIVRGDFCMAFLPNRYQTALVNWKDGRGVFLDFVDSTENNINDSVRCLHLYHTHLLATGTFYSGFCVIHFRLSLLDNYWSSNNDYRTWRSFRYNTDGGRMLNLSPPVGEGPWMLTSHVFTPTWKNDAPAEMYIVAYNGMWDIPKVFLSFRVQINVTGEGLALSLKRVGRTSAARLPLDSHCVSNSGHVVCLRKELRCYTLFSGSQQPETELTMDVLEEGDINPAITVEPWSGAIVVSTNGGVVRIFRLR